MKILLDEDLPRQLRKFFPDHDVFTTQWMGWNGKENGELLALMENQNVDVFLTADKNMQYQQNVSGFHVAIIFLQISRLRIEEIEPLVPEVLRLLDFVKPGHSYKIEK